MCFACISAGRKLTGSTQYGLIGSTEWGEDFADFIDEHVVAYLNLGTPLPNRVTHLLNITHCRFLRFRTTA